MTETTKGKLEEIDNAIRGHYFECECPDGCKHEVHASAILSKIMKIIDYKPRNVIE